MKIVELWKKLEPLEENLPTLKKDLAEGKVPELPYFIINQEAAKATLLGKISDIDGRRMQTNLVIASYGNGKTNLIKYLKLYFQTEDYPVKVIYSRADIEQPDLIIFLLKLIQDHYTPNLISSIKSLRTDKSLARTLANNYDDNFASIKEYCELIFDDKLEEEQIKKLLYLGTGRLYSKANFSSFGLEQFNNFNRREILAFFLNILAKSNDYIIFGIDEVEKIREKSNLRFSQFLTTYRELVDLFNKISGHYLVTCLTFAQNANEIQEANDALYSRIKQDIIELSPIEKREDFQSLVEHLNELFDTRKIKDDINKISAQIYKKKGQSNREIIRSTAELLLNKEERYSLKQLLSDYSLTEIFNKTENDLRLQGAFVSLHRKFFDPLEYFLESNHLLNETQLERQSNQAFIDNINKKVQVFVFNDQADLVSLNRKLNDLAKRYIMNMVIYSPKSLELSNSSIVIEDSNLSVTIVDYNPESLFVLLNMYREYIEHQNALGTIISSITEFNL